MLNQRAHRISALEFLDFEAVFTRPRLDSIPHRFLNERACTHGGLVYMNLSTFLISGTLSTDLTP